MKILLPLFLLLSLSLHAQQGGSFSGPTYGVTNASAAAAGQVGEIFTNAVAAASGQSLQTTVPTNITSITLTAGDWDVEGIASFTATSATITATTAGIVTTANTVPADGTEGYSGLTLTTTTEINSVTLPRKQINVTASTTVYLTGKCTFSAGSIKAFGAITARRVR